MEQRVAKRWFSLPNIVLVWPVPIVALAAVVSECRALYGPRDAAPFAAAFLLFLLSYLGIAIGIWPNDRPLPFHPGGGGAATKHASIPLGRRALPTPRYSDVFGPVLLGVSGRAASEHRLPLRRTPRGGVPP
jgi:hypothetical protein